MNTKDDCTWFTKTKSQLEQNLLLKKVTYVRQGNILSYSTAFIWYYHFYKKNAIKLKQYILIVILIAK